MSRLVSSVLLCLFLSLTFYNYNTECAKILGVLPVPSYSHYVLIRQIMEELARRGHQVTLISPYPLKDPIKNFRNIVSVRDWNEIRKNLLDLHESTVFYNIQFILKASSELTENFLKHESFQKLIQSNETFDAVLLEYFQNEAMMALGYHYKAPLVLLSPMPPSAWIDHLVANPHCPSYMPYIQSSFSSEMSFVQRVLNTIYDNTYHIRRELIAMSEQERLLKKYFPNPPELDDVRYNTSIFLVNSHESINNAVPHVPNMIQIGGAHVSPPKPLPANLQDFLDGATEGVVLFSMGSNLKSAELPVEMRNNFLKAFSKIKQKVLWKFEEELPDLPKNVRIEKWLPQQDVLAHPNIVAFITHGGLMSSIEAVYFGVPLIGIPVFGDQKMNMARAVGNGYALSMPLKELTEETLLNTINEVLLNPKYRQEVKKRSSILHDQQMKPVETAAYWIEYAIRHKGAPHLRSAALNLKWYQRNLLDVYAFLLFSIIIFIYILKQIVTFTFSVIRRKKVVKDDISKKNK